MPGRAAQEPAPSIKAPKRAETPSEAHVTLSVCERLSNVDPCLQRSVLQRGHKWDSELMSLSCNHQLLLFEVRQPS